MDPAIHAQMTDLLMRKKLLEREANQKREEVATWSSRVELATHKGMGDLATQAQAKVDALRTKIGQIQTDIDILNQESDMLRYEHKRPKGNEVARAEALVESFRLSGLVDLDKDAIDREFDDLEAQNVKFDFDKNQNS